MRHLSKQTGAEAGDNQGQTKVAPPLRAPPPKTTE